MQDVLNYKIVINKEKDMSNADKWIHRSNQMKCQSCMWFSIKAQDADKPVVSTPLGRCRRHAPTMNGYPVVFLEDWCGDHKLDENKL